MNKATLTHRSVRGLHLLIISVLLATLAIAAAPVARAADQVVTTNADSGAGSLRQAIVDAGDGDTITFNLSSGNETIIISSELAIAESLTIDGSNTAGSGTAVTVQVTTPGTSAWRVFSVNNAGKITTIENMTIRGGDISGLSGVARLGGGILLGVDAGTLNLNNVTVKDSKAYQGGGIATLR